MPGGLPPLSEISKWPVPNYVDPVTQPPKILILSCVMGPISIAILCIRFWVRIRLQKNLGWDDTLIAASFLPVLALTIAYPIGMQKYQANRHSWDVEPSYYPILLRYNMATYTIFTPACGFIKISILLFIRRLSFRVVSPTFLWSWRILMASLIATTIAFTLLPIFACNPIYAYWDRVYLEIGLIPRYEFTCIDEQAHILSNGVIYTIQDFFISLLPTILYWNLQIPFRKKLALYFLLALSYSSTAVGAMRTYAAYYVFYRTYDITWYANDGWFWALLEIHIGFVCANAPALKAFLSHIMGTGQLWSTVKSTGSKATRPLDMNLILRNTGSVSNLQEKNSSCKSIHRHSGSNDAESFTELHTTTDKDRSTIQMDTEFDLQYEQLESKHTGYKVDLERNIPNLLRKDGSTM